MTRSERPDRTSEWKALRAHYQEIKDVHLRTLFAEDPGRGERLVAEGGGLILDYSKNRVRDETMRLLGALAESAWGVFAIGASIPIALAMGLYIHKIRGGSVQGVREATVVGVVALLLCVVFGKQVQDSSFGAWLLFDEVTITLMIAVYGFVASVLPVWMLLCPRDYLSSYMKIGTILLLVAGIMIVNPAIEMPALNAIGPGTTNTPINANFFSMPGMVERFLMRTPLGRIAEADEIATVAVFLASDDASYVTGTTIYADGGRLALNGLMARPQ